MKFNVIDDMIHVVKEENEEILQLLNEYYRGWVYIKFKYEGAIFFIDSYTFYNSILRYTVKMMAFDINDNDSIEDIREGEVNYKTGPYDFQLQLERNEIIYKLEEKVSKRKYTLEDPYGEEEWYTNESKIMKFNSYLKKITNT